MKIVTDPDVYGQAAKVGVFITLEEMAEIKGFDVLEKAAEKTFKRAEKKREYYRDLHDSGEASERQTTSLFRWDARASDAERIVNNIRTAKRQWLRKKNK